MGAALPSPPPLNGPLPGPDRGPRPGSAGPRAVQHQGHGILLQVLEGQNRHSADRILPAQKPVMNPLCLQGCMASHSTE